jgi:hypothetical protein
MRALQWTAILVVGWSVPVIIGVSGHFVGMSMAMPDMPASHLIGHSIATWWPWIPVTPLAVLAWRRLPRHGAGVALIPLAHLAFVCLAYLLQASMAVVIGHRTGHVLPSTGVGSMALRSVSDLALYDLIIYGSILAVIFGLDTAKRYRDRDLIASQLEAQLAQARLSAVQMQLQPHFLFNALNSVAMLVRAERSRDALDVIVGFSELLRYVLDEAGTTDVPLRVELRFAKQYLDIEKVRYGARLIVAIDSPSELDEALVPNLVLQPLVENAIKHGVSTRAAGGAITVRAARRGNQLVLSVRNDGPLLPNGWSLDDADGVGLRNVRDRLQAASDATATLSIANTSDGAGVEATVTLPYRTRRSVHDASVARHGAASDIVATVS